MNEETQDMRNDHLGAFCRENHVALKPTGAGILDGLTFAAKDVFHIAGVRTGFGNPDWLATHPPEEQTAAVVRSMLDAGAELIGKTVTDELTYSLTGENAHYGTPVNPAAPDRIPGGSSNGSASAVAGNLVDFALGTDCGGSVRLPASYCGILGMRPTHGRVSVDGVIPFAGSFDVVGWFATDPDTFERVGSILLNEPASETLPRRLLLADDAFDLVLPEVRAAVQPDVSRLAEIVGASENLTVSRDGLRAWFEIFRIVQGSELWANRKAWIEEVKPTIGPGVRERIEWASSLGDPEIADATKAYTAIKTYIREKLEPGDVLCLPTSPRVAPLKSEPASTLENEYRMQAMCLLCIAGLGGLPQVSLPVADVDGLPLGLSIVGAPGSDMQLLALAKAVMAVNE